MLSYNLFFPFIFYCTPFSQMITAPSQIIFQTLNHNLIGRFSVNFFYCNKQELTENEIFLNESV